MSFDETYQIENEFIYQFDSFQFVLLPECVVDEYERILGLDSQPLHLINARWVE